MATPQYYDRITQAVRGLTNQLNINAARDLQIEQQGLQRLEQTQNSMLQLQRDKRAQEFQKAQIANMESSRQRAEAAEGRAETAFNLSLPGLQFNNLKFKNAMDTSPVNVKKWFNNDPHLMEQLQTNTAMQKNIAQIFGNGAVFNPKTMDVVGPDGEPIVMSGFDQANKGVQLLGVVESHIDPLQAINNKKLVIDNQIKSLSAEYKKLGHHEVARKAELSKQLAVAKASLGEANRQLSPMNLFQFYNRKDRLLKAAHAIASNNASDPAYISLLSDSISNNNKQLIKLQEGLSGKSGSGGGKGSHKYAIPVDPVTNKPSGKGMWITVPKDDGGSMPEDLDGRASDGNWVWKEDLTAASTSGANPVEFKLEKVMFNRFGKQDAKGQWFIPEENIGQHRNASSYAVDLLGKFPGHNKIDIANQAENLAREDHRAVIDMIRTASEDESIAKEDKKKVVEGIILDFMGDLKSRGMFPYNPYPKFKIGKFKGPKND